MSWKFKESEAGMKIVDRYKFQKLYSITENQCPRTIKRPENENISRFTQKRWINYIYKIHWNILIDAKFETEYRFLTASTFSTRVGEGSISHYPLSSCEKAASYLEIFQAIRKNF